MIAHRGFHGASIEAICAEAGYTGGAFSSNFASKEELFAALLHERVFKVWGEMPAQAGSSELRRP